MPSALPQRKLRRDAEENRQRILEAAAALIGERGLTVSHDDIARVAGVGVGTVYRRFPSRTELFDALYLAELDVMVELAQAAAALPDPWLAIRAFFTTTFEQQAAHRGLRELLIGHGGGVELARVAQQRIEPIIARLVERAVDSGQLRADVTVTDMAVVPIVINAVLNSSRSVAPELWRRWLDIVLDGLAAGLDRAGLAGVAPRSDQVTSLIANR